MYDCVQTVDEKMKFGDEKSKSAESLSRRIVRRKRASPGSSFGTAIVLEFAGQVDWLKRYTVQCICSVFTLLDGLWISVTHIL